mmetsp:Transcript_13385/g.40479  ORF Transcript_13385/g.40479 Transcript_13385/m.40479 type:complete len:208 (+) Transcript_13385:1928-2551(+)
MQGPHVPGPSFDDGIGFYKILERTSTRSFESDTDIWRRGLCEGSFITQQVKLPLFGSYHLLHCERLWKSLVNHKGIRSEPSSGNDVSICQPFCKHHGPSHLYSLVITKEHLDEREGELKGGAGATAGDDGAVDHHPFLRLTLVRQAAHEGWVSGGQAPLQEPPLLQHHRRRSADGCEEAAGLGLGHQHRPQLPAVPQPLRPWHSPWQ